MKTQLAKNLKKFLDSMPKEEIHKKWNEIVALGLQGPTVDDYLAYSASFQNLSSVEFHFDVKESSKIFQLDETSLAPAA